MLSVSPCFLRYRRLPEAGWDGPFVHLQLTPFPGSRVSAVTLAHGCIPWAPSTTGQVGSEMRGVCQRASEEHLSPGLGAPAPG